MSILINLRFRLTCWARRPNQPTGWDSPNPIYNTPGRIGVSSFTSRATELPQMCRTTGTSRIASHSMSLRSEMRAPNDVSLLDALYGDRKNGFH